MYIYKCSQYKKELFQGVHCTESHDMSVCVCPTNMYIYIYIWRSQF